MAEVPNSYKDPYWTNLSTMMEKKHGLPSGLLVNIVQKGERTDNNKSSPVGAKTVYQIMPNTRKLFLKKYGVDAYASPKAAAEVAALHLKESLQRNKGDVSTAVREYHGGPNRSGWGKVNDAYVSRVLGGGQQQTERPSRLERAKQRVTERQEMSQQSLDNIYRAYKSGKMTAQEKADYERDVENGSIMLGRGQTLDKGKKSADQKGVLLPQGVADAYYNNTMTPEERADLERDRKAGLVRLPVPTKMQSDIPDFDEQGVIRQEPTELTEVIEPELPPTVAERLKGAGETALALGTGATGGAVGQVAGTAKGIANALLEGEFGTAQGARNIEQSAMQGAEALTYQPRTATGQQYTQNVGEALAPAVALTPALAELAIVGQAARGVAPIAVGEGQRAAQAVGNVANRTIVQPIKNAAGATAEAIKSGAAKVGNAVGLGGEARAPDNLGAAAVPSADIREQLFNDFNVNPMEAQVSRDPTQLAELYNTARKGGEAGKIVQTGLDEQQASLASAIDDMIEGTGARTTNATEVGASIKDVLNTQFKVEKVNQRKNYNAVVQSEGAKTKVDVVSTPKWSDKEVQYYMDEAIIPDNRSLLDAINEESYLNTSKVYSESKDRAVKLGIADLDKDGNLIPKPKGQEPNVLQIEEFRQRIGHHTDGNDNLAANMLRAKIDNALDNSGSNAFKNARKQYRDFKQSWENRAIISDMIKLKKNSADPKLINERVIDRMTSKATSQQDLEFIKKMVNKTDEGKAAWSDLQGAVLDKIRNEAFSGAADQDGNQSLVFSKMDKVIKKLDGDTQRLNTILGDKQGQRVRDAGELARIIQTVPPNTGVNWSNTATAIAAAIDGMIFGSTGMPAPVASALRVAVSHIKNKKDVARATNLVKRYQKPQATGNFK